MRALPHSMWTDIFTLPLVSESFEQAIQIQESQSIGQQQAVIAACTCHHMHRSLQPRVPAGA